MKNSIVLLDLFAGFGGAELSAKFAGIKVKKSYISEVDKSALKLLKHHYPDAIFVGDIRFLKGSDFLDVTHVTGGTPCPDFSFAGKKSGMVTTTNVEITNLKQYLKHKKDGFEFKGQSYLFWEACRLYKEITDLQKKKNLPVAKFLFENVKMEKKWEDVISNALGVNPIVFDASKVSAQNRYRLFWTNFAENIDVPKDMNIKIGDIIKGAVNGTGFRGRKIGNDKKYSFVQTIRNDNKCNCLTTSLGTIASTGKYYGTGFYIDKKGKVKKLTIEQAEILQGLDSGYTKVKDVSDTARIRMIGNGWSIPVTGRIFEYIKKGNKKILKSK